MKYLSDLDYGVARRYPYSTQHSLPALMLVFSKIKQLVKKVLIGIELSLLSANGLLNVTIT